MGLRQYTLLDKILIEVDAGITTLLGQQHSSRDNPADTIVESPLTQTEKQHSQGYMRVNHTGEVCAQALYRGQSLMARTASVQELLTEAGAEEEDHLAWTHQRLRELNTHRSYLNFIWYTNAFLMGVVAGLAGDRWSLGFVEETERQVSDHLAGHMQALPEADEKSRAIVQAMQVDEMRHGHSAKTAGASELPAIIQRLMQCHAKVMTTVAYWV